MPWIERAVVAASPEGQAAVLANAQGAFVTAIDRVDTVAAEALRPGISQHVPDGAVVLHASTDEYTGSIRMGTSEGWWVAVPEAGGWRLVWHTA